LSIGPSKKVEVVLQGAVCLSPQWLVNISEACSLCLAVCVSCCIGFSLCKVIILGTGNDLTLRSYILSAEENFLYRLMNGVLGGFLVVWKCYYRAVIRACTFDLLAKEGSFIHSERGCCSNSYAWTEAY
jgi:hypothetical protein